MAATKAHDGLSTWLFARLVHRPLCTFYWGAASESGGRVDVVLSVLLMDEQHRTNAQGAQAMMQEVASYDSLSTRVLASDSVSWRPCGIVILKSTGPTRVMLQRLEAFPQRGLQPRGAPDEHQPRAARGELRRRHLLWRHALELDVRACPVGARAYTCCLFVVGCLPTRSAHLSAHECACARLPVQ